MDFQSLKIAHYDLMKKYFDTLNIVSDLPQFPEFPLLNKEYKTTLRKQIINFQDHHIERLDYRLAGITTTRFFVSFFVEWHIRRKLNSLLKIYAQFEQSINPDDADAIEKIKWLRDSQEKMQKFSDTLSVFSSFNRFLRDSIMIISGFLMAALGVNSIYNAIILFFNLSIDPIFYFTIPFAIVFLLYIFFFLESAFSYKRLLFHLASSVTSDNTPMYMQKNVYQLENNIYSILGRKKQSEFPINVAIELFFILIIIAFGISTFFVTHSDLTRILSGFLVILLLIRMYRYYHQSSNTRYQ